MVFYIRFLKTPKFVKAKPRESPSAHAVITVTSDLGDYFYAGYLNLIVRVERNGNHNGETAIVLSWKNGMRALPFDIPLGKAADNEYPLRLRVSESTAVTSQLSLHKLPSIVSGLSATFDNRDERQAEMQVERRFDLGSDGACELRMWEETGESIARHIWYTTPTDYATYLTAQ
jgi:hypothetical protein